MCRRPPISPRTAPLFPYTTRFRSSEKDVPWLLVQRVARLRCQRTLDSDFLATLIGSKSFEKYVLLIQTGTGVPHISATQTRGYVFHLPSVEEQRRIVGRPTTIKSVCSDLARVYTATQIGGAQGRERGCK